MRDTFEPTTGKWEELKETIEELSTNDGNASQNEVCRFLLNLMNELEKQEDI